MAAPSSGVMVRTAPRTPRAPRPSSSAASPSEADPEGLEHLVERVGQAAGIDGVDVGEQRDRLGAAGQLRSQGVQGGGGLQVRQMIVWNRV